MAQMTALLANAMRPRMVKSHPFPIALMMGDVTTPPTQEKILRTKLLTATPEADRLGMNSVSMVVAMLKMSMEPIPKKKPAIIWQRQSSAGATCERGVGSTYRDNPMDSLLDTPPVPDQSCGIDQSANPGILPHSILRLIH